MMPSKPFAQHMPSNQREMTDHFLVEGSPYYSVERNRADIELLKQTHEVVEVTDEEIASIREASANTLNIGDAVEIILAREFRQYTGMIDAARTEQEETEAPKVKVVKSIQTCYYDPEMKTTYYLIA
jgi:hypothetical protein